MQNDYPLQGSGPPFYMPPGFPTTNEQADAIRHASAGALQMYENVAYMELSKEANNLRYVLSLFFSFLWFEDSYTSLSSLGTSLTAAETEKATWATAYNQLVQSRGLTEPSQAPTTLSNKLKYTTLFPLSYKKQIDRLKRDDFNKIKYWSAKEYQDPKTGLRAWNFLQHDDGTLLESLDRKEVTNWLWALWDDINLTCPGVLKSSYGRISLTLRGHMENEAGERFPFFRRCAGKWKVQRTLSELFPNFARGHIQDDTNIKQEDDSNGNSSRERKDQHSGDVKGTSNAKRRRLDDAEDEDYSGEGDEIMTGIGDQDEISSATPPTSRPEPRSKLAAKTKTSPPGSRAAAAPTQKRPATTNNSTQSSTTQTTVRLNSSIALQERL
ncbi:hypothetical protein BDN72DRAFT_896482 [Pluteus cervinus]|uniref:Uncharacterized protein n=1 Tax=Pluteus cervinus TaxID=181527 RepID=A0ACD3AXL7_9AGAR|nr:hypothetical protein BDN72DRAFT_896482 [Pluteus cervinus]